MSGLKRKIAFWIECFVGYLDRKGQGEPKEENSVLVVKLDALGDYFLWRGYWEEVRKNLPENTKICFLGNNLLRDFVRHWDGEYVEEFIGVEVNKIWIDTKYRNKLIKQLENRKFKWIIQPTFSRKYCADKLLKEIKGEEKVANQGDNRNGIPLLLRRSESYFDRVISIDDPGFEIARNAGFLSALFNKGIQPRLGKFKNVELGEKKRGIVFFPEASVVRKEWPEAKVIETINWIQTELKLPVVLAGINVGKSDRIVQGCGNIKPISYVGKTNLNELLNLINQYELLITNDTVAAHIGPALNIKTIVLVVNENFGPFSYPKYLCENVKYINPPVETDDISAIQVKSVQNQIRKFFSNAN